MNVIDAVIILGLLLGGVLGYKQGFFRSTVTAIGSILSLVAAWYLKGYLATLCYKYLPFIHFKNNFAGLQTLNIFIYEALSFLIIFIVLVSILHVLIDLTKGLEKVLDFTIILGIPSKIFGALFGFIEAYVILFILLFLFAQCSFSAIVLHDSYLTPIVLNSTPVLSNVTHNTYKAFIEVYDMSKNYENIKDKTKYNLDSLDIMLKYKVVSIDNVKLLKENGKLQIKNIDSVINKYNK